MQRDIYKKTHKIITNIQRSKSNTRNIDGRKNKLFHERKISTRKDIYNYIHINISHRILKKLHWTGSITKDGTVIYGRKPKEDLTCKKTTTIGK